jgi:hypothetical protein
LAVEAGTGRAAALASGGETFAPLLAPGKTALPYLARC